MTGLSPPGPLNEVNLACRRRVLESQKENPLAASKIRFQEATKSQIDALRDVALLPYIREFQKRCKF